MQYAQIAVSMPQIGGTFDYHLPEHLATKVKPGQLVLVPFGQRTVQGVVLRPVTVPQVTETKAIYEIVDETPVLSPQQIALAETMAHDNLSSAAAFVDLMVPPGLSRHVDTLYRLIQPEPRGLRISPLQRSIIGLITERGELRGRQLAAEFKQQDWRRAMRGLVKQGLVSASSLLNPPRAAPKLIKTIQINPDIFPSEFEAGDLGRGAAGERRLSVLHYLFNESEPVEPAWIYANAGAKPADIKYLADKELIQTEEAETWRDPLSGKTYQMDIPPVLSADQQAALAVIEAQLSTQGNQVPVLLHGVTGSGKTEVYLRAVDKVLTAGKQALVMVPEISLTPQTVQRFMSRFPGKVGIQHSRLSDGERFDTWRRLRQGDLAVIVGPRSALFMPFSHLGLIVIDEFHDQSYYQDDFPPSYDSVKGAITYAGISHCPVVLGSATPDLALYYQARQKRWPIVTLPDRVYAHRNLGPSPEPAISGNTLPLPQVKIADMRAELRAGNLSIFSFTLQEALKRTLQAGQQSILFLNRRGNLTYIFCRDCGAALKCPRCDLPLTSHTTSERDDLKCHTCGYTRKMPNACPACGSKRIKQFGTGTEKVEEEVIRLLPGVRTLRWDAETTRVKSAHEIILEHFKNHQADVLIGTQMLSKGLDLPLVTLVGVVLADVGLNLPDYRANERTFQHLMQVAGRAGRSALGGNVIMQSFTPDHFAIQAAARHDFAGFYAAEIENRRKYRYPPVIDLVKLEYRHTDNEKAQAQARLMAERIQQWIRESDSRTLELVGPHPSFFSRVNREYRWQLLLKGLGPVGLLQDKSLPGWQIQVNPPSIL